MDVRQLRYFLTIAEEGQITRAAKKLNMAQPPLSQQLKLLEQELDVKLVERNGRKMELTEAGKILYKRAENILNQLNETKTEVKEMGEGIRGVLSVGSVISCFSYLPERVRFFRQQYPLVTFQLREGDSYRLVQYVENRDVELAIVHLPLEKTHFSMIPLPAEPFTLVMPKEWDMDPSKTTIQMAEIAEIPLLLMRRLNGRGIYEIIVEECNRHGFEPQLVGDCPDAAMLLWLVSSGICATILPKSTLSALPATDLKIMDIEDSSIQSEAGVIWLKDRFLSKSAVRFIDTFRNHDGNS
ncbi:LysR family transcriptional regulator [Pseudalkalibacillus decolorationis]|uniref:LysR family transcriptional regulator n=1 Tax=Pseudalkalibacillus decolorationis TaxID=163879 RepID=UPI00214979BA|nr:LysR family transcriptional regulator [Pseudalkalibacillus decolorationis]